MLALVDDCSGSTSASLEALLFAGRRLGAEGIVLLGSLRDGERRSPDRIRGSSGSGRARSATTRRARCSARRRATRLAPPVAERLVAATRRQPARAARDPDAAVATPSCAGREPLAAPLRPGAAIERAFRRRVDAAARGTRRALLVAAARETGALDAIAAARSRRSGCDATALEPAEAAGLLSAARTASSTSAIRCCARPPTTPPAAAERRLAHRALADAAAAGQRGARLAPAPRRVAPDEDVAAALEAAGAGRARPRRPRDRGARLRAAPRSCTPDDDARARRLLEAASDAAAIGEGEQALALAAARPRLAADPLLTASDVRRMAGAHPDPPRLDPRRLRAALVAEAERVRGADPRARRRDVPRGVGLRT